jgi:hypothetical protein
MHCGQAVNVQQTKLGVLINNKVIRATSSLDEPLRRADQSGEISAMMSRSQSVLLGSGRCAI